MLRGECVTMERRFSCTACGKCCHGQVPLTIADALAHADKFPLAIVWSTVRKGGRSFQTTGELGVTIQVKKNAGGGAGRAHRLYTAGLSMP